MERRIKQLHLYHHQKKSMNIFENRSIPHGAESHYFPSVRNFLVTRFFSYKFNFCLREGCCTPQKKIELGIFCVVAFSVLAIAIGVVWLNGNICEMFGHTHLLNVFRKPRPQTFL